jgi:hypothetical protein
MLRPSWNPYKKYLASLLTVFFKIPPGRGSTSSASDSIEQAKRTALSLPELCTINESISSTAAGGGGSPSQRGHFRGKIPSLPQLQAEFICLENQHSISSRTVSISSNETISRGSILPDLTPHEIFISQKAPSRPPVPLPTRPGLPEWFVKPGDRVRDFAKGPGNNSNFFQIA